MAQPTTGSALPDPLPRIRVVAAVIEHQGRYLITQRRESAVLPLLWEFPGGKVEPPETDQEALRREIQHRITVEVRVGKLISFVTHKYERYSVDLHLYECQIAAGEPQAANVGAFAWVRSDDFDQYAFTPADEASVSQLLEL
jgi:8-oxo-dGTP diphosphatase